MPVLIPSIYPCIFGNNPFGFPPFSIFSILKFFQSIPVYLCKRSERLKKIEFTIIFPPIPVRQCGLSVWFQLPIQTRSACQDRQQGSFQALPLFCGEWLSFWGPILKGRFLFPWYKFYINLLLLIYVEKIMPIFEVINHILLINRGINRLINRKN